MFLFRGFKKFLKNYKRHNNPHFLLSKDKEKINKLSKEGMEYMEKLREIDEKLIAIQNSTRTTIPQFGAIHNYLRMRVKWYYNWHLNPHASKIHWGALSLYTFVLFGALVYGMFGAPYKPTLAESGITCTSVQSGSWSDEATWNDADCGAGRVPGSGDDVVISSTHTVTLAGPINIGDGDISISGTLTTNNYAVTAGDLTINANGTMNVGSSTVTLSGNFDSSASGAKFGTSYPGGDTSTIVFTNTGGATVKETAFSTGQGFYNFTINANVTVTALSALQVRNILTVNSGASLTDGANSYSLWLYSTSTTIAPISNSGDITGMDQYIYRGSGTDVLVAATTYSKLTLVPVGNANFSFKLDTGTTTCTTLNVDHATAGYTATLNTNNQTLTCSSDLNIGGYASANGNGAITAGASAINVAGNFTINTDGTFTANTSTVTLNSSSANQTVTTGGQSFYNLTINNTQTTYDDIIISGNLVVNGALTITDGELKLSTNNPNVYTAGNVTIGTAGSVTKGTGTWIFNGTGTLTDSTATLQDLGAVSIANSSTRTQGSNIKMSSLNIGYGSTYDLAGYNFSFRTATAVSNGGTFKLKGNETLTNVNNLDIDSGTVVYYGRNIAETLTLKDFGETDYYYLTINDTNANKATFALSGALNVAQDLNVVSGTLSTGSSDLTVYGTVTLSGGSLTGGSGTMSFGIDGMGGLTISSASSTFVASATVYIYDAYGYLRDAGMADWITNASTLYLYASIYLDLPADTYNNLELTHDYAPYSITGATNISGNLAIHVPYGVGEATLDVGAYTLTVGGTVTIDPSCTLSVTSGTINVAGNWSNSGTFTAGTGTVNFDGNTQQTITTNNQPFYNLTLNNTGTNGTANDDIVISGNLDVNGTLTITDGELNLATYDPNVTLAGDVSINSGGAWTKQDNGTSTVVFDGTNAATFEDLNTTKQNLGLVTINKTDTTNPPANNKLTLKTVSGNGMKVSTLTINGTAGSADTLDLGAGGYTLEIAGTGSASTVFTNNGTLIPGTSTVKYTATNTTGNVNVATTTYNSLQLSGAETYDLTGNLADSNALTGNLTIDSGAVLDIRPGTTDYNITATNITISGTLDATSSSSTITATGNWDSSAGTFIYGTSTVDLTGTGSLKGTGDAWTPNFYNLTMAAEGKTTTLLSHVAIADTVTFGTGTVSGSDYILTMKKSSGTPLVNNGATINLSQIIYYPASEGTVTVAGGNYGTLSYLKMFAEGTGRVFNFGGPITVSGGLSFRVNDSVTDTIFNTQNNNVTATEIQIGGYASGGGTINFGSSAVDIGSGGLYISNNGGNYTLNLQSASVTNSGNWTLSSGSGSVTQNPATSTVTFNGNTQQTITTNNQPFYNLTLNNTGTNGTANDDIVISGNLDVNGALTITDGELKLSTNNPNVYTAGNVTIESAGSVTKGTGTWTFDGAVAQNLQGNSQDLGNVSVAASTEITQTGATATLAGVTIDTLNISADSSIWNAASSNFTIATLSNNGTFQLTGDNATKTITNFDSDSGTVEYTATSGSRSILNKTYYNLKINGSGGTFTLPAAITINGHLDIAAGTLSTNDQNLTIYGNWTNAGTFNPGSGTVTFAAGSGSQTLNSGGTGSGKAFYNLTHSGAGTLQLSTNNLDIDGNFVNSAGTFDTANKNMTVAGNWTNSGTFMAGTGTVTLDGAAQQTVTTGGQAFNNLSVTNSSTDDVSFADALTVNGTFTDTTAGSKLTFKDGTTNTISTINWQGTDGDANNNIKLRSSSTGTAFKLSYTTLAAADYLDVQDSNNLGDLIVVAHGKDSGNNTNWYLTANYTITTHSPQIAGVGWSETLTAKDYYNNTSTSSSNTTVTMTSSSSAVKFYTSSAYTTETTTYTLSSGVATIYVKALSSASETITITATDSQGKAVTSGNISVSNDIPSSSITSPKTGTTVGAGIVQLQGTASDTEGGVVASVKIQIVKEDGTVIVNWADATNTGTDFSTWSYDWEVSASSAYTIKSKATDSLGASETPGSGITIFVDKEIPSVKITNPAPNEWFNTATYDIKGTSQDLGHSPISKVELSVDSGKTWVSVNNTGTNFSTWQYSFANYTDGKYTFWAKATDEVGNVSQIYTVSAGADRTAPSRPSNLKAFDVSNRLNGAYQTLVDFVSSTDELSGLKEYEIFRDGQKIATTTDNFYVDEKLQTKSYSYQVKAIDNAGNSQNSERAEINLVAKETLKPTISDIKAIPSKIVTKDEKTSALITWKTDKPATSQVFYGLGGAKANQEGLDVKLNTAHSVILENLKPSTTYHFAVLSKDIYGNQVESQDMTFTTMTGAKKESVLDIILKTLQKAFEWFKKAMASPSILDKLGLLKAPEQITPSVMVFDVSSPEIKKYQALVLVVNQSPFVLERSTDGQNFSQLTTVSDKNWYLDRELETSKTYYYRVKGVPGSVSLRPAGLDPTAPLLTDIKTKNLGIGGDKASVLISFQTDKLAMGQVEIEGQMVKEEGFNQSHALVLEDLKPGTTYKFKVSSSTEAGARAVSSEQTLTTPSPPEEKTTLQLILEILQRTFSSLRKWLSM